MKTKENEARHCISEKEHYLKDSHMTVSLRGPVYQQGATIWGRASVQIQNSQTLLLQLHYSELLSQACGPDEQYKCKGIYLALIMIRWVLSSTTEFSKQDHGDIPRWSLPGQLLLLARFTVYHGGGLVLDCI